MPETVAGLPGPRPFGGRAHRLPRLVDRATFFGQLRRAVIRNDGIRAGLALLSITPDPLDPGAAGGAWEIRQEVCLLTAGRLVGCLHYSYPASRVASDEFLVLAEGVGTVAGAVDLAEQILLAVRRPEMMRSGEDSVTASVGIAMQEPRSSAEQLQNNAAAAMYLARTGGGDRYQVYGEWMGEADVAPTRAG